MYKITAFDFDGTITTKDTLWMFIKFAKGPFRFYLGIILLIPILFISYIGIISNQRGKEILLSFFFKGKSRQELEEMSALFANEVQRVIRPCIMKEIESNSSKQDTTVIIVSASPRIWIEPWANSNNIDCIISTELEFDDQNRFTGKFLGKNCYGLEKKNRFLEQFPNRNEYTLSYYGDSRGDKEMIEIADDKNYRTFID